MRVTQREIDQTYLDHHASYGGVREDYFALLYLMKKFKLSRDEAAAQIAFGGNDYGFDGFHFDRDTRNFYVFQFKWSDNSALFKESLKRLITAGMEAVFATGGDVDDNEILRQLRAVIHENKALIERVFVQFVFNGDTGKAEESAVLSAYREDLENKRYLVHQRLGRDTIEFAVQYISNKTFKIAGDGPDGPQNVFEIEYQSPLEASTSSGYTMHVGFTNIADLLKMYRTMGQQLFDRNIRSGLAADKAANRAIRNALRDIVLNDHKPEDFVFNHNGISMSVERLDVISETHVRLLEPRILNGAQTITSAAKCVDDNAENVAFKKNEKKLQDVRVLARVVCANSQDFITQVTICNNRQNPVNAWNLRASDMIQLEFEDRFREELGIFYERQEGAFAAFAKLSPIDREERGIQQGRPIEIRRLAHTFLATQGEVDKFSRISDVFENDKLYRETFRETYLSVDPRRILLAYKIQFPLGRVIHNTIESSAAKFEILRRAKNLIWALLFQALWNQAKLPEYLDMYGTSISIQFAFVDLLSTLVGTKVKPIINEAMKRPHYQAKLGNEEFGFFRTNLFFKECMDIAYDKYDWKKFSLSSAVAAKT